MIRVHIETAKSEEYVSYTNGVKYNFSPDGSWVLIWNQEEQLIASLGSKFVIRIEIMEGDGMDVFEESFSTSTSSFSSEDYP